jgi:hypothetical protein
MFEVVEKDVHTSRMTQTTAKSKALEGPLDVAGRDPI